MVECRNENVSRWSRLPVCKLMNAIRRRMCEDDRWKFCPSWNHDLEDEMLKNDARRLRIITTIRPYTDLLSSISVISLDELQNRVNLIAEKSHLKIEPLDWKIYLKEIFNNTINVTSNQMIVLEDAKYFQEIIKFIYSMQSTKIELLIWWNVVSAFLPFADEDVFNVKLSTISPPTTAEKTCAKTVTSAFPSAVNYLHIKKEKYSEKKIKIEEMFKFLRNSYQTLMQKVPWMDEKTREQSVKKLKSMKSLIAHPSVIERPAELDELYVNVRINNKDSLLDVIFDVLKLQNNQHLDKLNRTNDPEEYEWTQYRASAVNAFYVPYINTLYVPHSLLELPLYTNSLKSLDYGMIGAALGHEMSHGFDKFGRHFDEVGNLKNIWSGKSYRKFYELIDCFGKAYDEYSSYFNGIFQKVDSFSTNMEDVADNAGFKIALLAYKQHVTKYGVEPFLIQFENYTSEQLFTLGFANIVHSEIIFNRSIFAITPMADGKKLKLLTFHLK